MIAPLAVSKPWKALLNEAAHTVTEIQKRPRATAEIILVKNQTSFCTVVSLNLVSPDMARIRPMMVLSPVAKTSTFSLDDKVYHLWKMREKVAYFSKNHMPWPRCSNFHPAELTLNILSYLPLDTADLALWWMMSDES
jgi:hypothetical protein